MLFILFFIRILRILSPGVKNSSYYYYLNFSFNSRFLSRLGFLEWANRVILDFSSGSIILNGLSRGNIYYLEILVKPNQNSF